MSRPLRIAMLLLIAGCSKQLPKGINPPNDDVAVVDSMQDSSAQKSPRLVSEKAPDLTVQPIPANRRHSPYSFPESYKPLHHGPTPAPTPLPVLPINQPVKIHGDRRFLAPGSGSGLALSPDGKRLVSGNCIFVVENGTLEASYYEIGGGVAHKIAFSPDGTRVYCSEGPQGNTPTHGNTLAVRDVPGKQQLITLGVSDWALSRDGRQLVTLERVYYDPYVGQSGPRHLVAHHYPAVRIYDTATLKGLAAYRIYDFGATAISFSPDGDQLLIGCDDGAIRIWDRATNRERLVIRDLCEAPLPTHKPIVHLIAFSPDGKSFAAANARPHDTNSSRQVAWWRWEDGKRIHLKEAPKYYDPTDLRFSPDGKYLFTGREGGTSVWETESGTLVTELTSEKNDRVVPQVTFQSNDRAFVQMGLRPGLVSFPLLKPVDWPDRPFVARTSSIDIQTTEEMPPLKPLPYPHPGYALPDGGRVRINPWPEVREGGFDQTDAAGKQIRRYEEGRTGSYAVSPDGKVLLTSASASGISYGAYDYAKWESPVRFWDLTTGKEKGVIRVYPSTQGLHVFSPDGKRIAILHADRLIRIWDVESRTPTLALDPAGYGFDRFVFSTDGRWIVAGSPDLPYLIVLDTTVPKK